MGHHILVTQLLVAPDDFAKALKDASIDILVTANNHSFDKGVSGVVRTIKVLDSLYINHTGTFKNFEDFKKITH